MEIVPVPEKHKGKVELAVKVMGEPKEVTVFKEGTQIEFGDGTVLGYPVNGPVVVDVNSIGPKFTREKEKPEKPSE